MPAFTNADELTIADLEQALRRLVELRVKARKRVLTSEQRSIRQAASDLGYEVTPPSDVAFQG